MDGRRWKWPLVACCALSVLWAIVGGVDLFGVEGWWQANQPATGRAYEARFDAVEPGGVTARAGIRDGDTFDLREQSFKARVGLAFQPAAHEPLQVVLHRGGQRRTFTVVPGSVWDVGAFAVWWATLSLVAALWLAACGLVIALRRADLFEGRVLAITLAVAALPLVPLAVPNAASTLASLTVSLAAVLFDWLMIAILSAAFGTRSMWRRVLEGFTYAAVALNLGLLAVFIYGLGTLRIDPMPSAVLNFRGSPGLPTLAIAILVLLGTTCAAAAVATTERSQRARAAWLLLPLPIGFLAANAFFQLQSIATSSWILILALQTLTAGSSLLAALAVSYALLKRRVFDFEFVLSRTLVVASVSLIVVAAFVLLEYVLGSVLSDVSRTTGVVANAMLALVLGVSMRYIHKRVDSLVEAVLFRKRHDDERALRDFSHEAAYVTETGALLDRTIDTVRRHTDARNASLMLDGAGKYSQARAFGPALQQDVDDNDGAVLALRTWHKPLDPHHYTTALNGALAVPMLARGRLIGLLLMGERAGGEAYAPDDVEALSQLAHSVGAAMDSLSARTNDSEITSLLEAIAKGQHAIVAELQALREAMHRTLT
jgi:hypothetical protein